MDINGELKLKLDAGRKAAAKDEGWYRIDDCEGNYPNPFFSRAGNCPECAHEYGLSSAPDDVARYECYPGICNWQARTDRNRQAKAAMLMRRLQTWVDNPRGFDEYETLTRKLTAMGVDYLASLKPVATEDAEDERDDFHAFRSVSRAREAECGLMPGWRERVIQDLQKEEENNDAEIY